MILLPAMLAVFLPTVIAADEIYTEENRQEYREIVGLMKALSVIEQEEEPVMTDTLTRGAMIRTLISFLEGGNPGKKDEYYQNQAVIRGILVGYDDGEYRLSQDVLLEEMVKSLVAGMGYGALNETYPQDYMRTARELGLLKGIETGEGVYLTWYQVMKLLYQALETPVLKITNEDGKTKLLKDENNTVLSEIYQMKKKKGIVTATEETALFEGEHLSDGVVEVDSVQYDTDMDCTGYLGYRVTYYLTEDEDRLIYMGWNWKWNQELTLRDDQLDDFLEMTYHYTDLAGASKRARLEQAVNVVYNGCCTGAYDEKLMMPEYGTVRLIDADDNGRYETVIIWRYEICVVQSKDVNKDQISFKNRAAVKLSDYDRAKILNTSGKEMQLEDVINGAAILLAESLHKEQGRFVLLSGEAGGTIEGISQEDDYDILTIDGEDYQTVKNYYKSRPVKFGESYSFYVDAEQRIVAMKEFSSQSRYGFLVKVYDNEDSEDTLIFKLFTQDGEMKKFDGAEKLYLDEIKRTTKAGTIEGLQKDEKRINPQLIKYQLDTSGRIKKIDTAYNFCTMQTGDYEAKKPNSAENSKFRVLYSSRLKGQGEKTFYAAGFNFGNTFMVENGTLLFQVPSDPDSANDQDYRIGNCASLGNESSYTVEAYTDLENEGRAAVLVTFDTGVTRNKNYLGIVEKIEETIDEEDTPVQKMYITGPVDLTCLNYDIQEISAKDNAAPGRTFPIEVGDIVSCQVSGDKLVGASMVYDQSTEFFSGASSSFGSWHYYTMANVYSNQDGIIGITQKTPDQTITRGDLQFYNANSYNHYIVEVKGGKVRAEGGDTDRIRSYQECFGMYDRVFVYSSYAYPWLMVFYKN